MDMIRDGGIRTQQIPGFENYFVSNDGKVVNVNTGREMALFQIQNGELAVGLVRDGRQFIRSVKVLVAEAFVDGKTQIFDTPILLNGLKDDPRADNIMWRPRWFAWKYSHQFKDIPEWCLVRPVMDMVSGLVYESVFHAGIENGLLFSDISLSIHNGTRVWPTGQYFSYI